MALTLTNILQTVREDDYVEYYLFPSMKSENEESELSSYVLRINNIVEKYSTGYLWHKDKFNIISRPTTCYLLCNEEFQLKERLPPHIYGILHYGDNIEDEWFTVFLLLQLTKEIEGLIVRVVDSDGEFVLIEAANFLPSWASPETCEKRVYLYKGQIHLIPNQQNNEEEISIQDALNMIYKEPLLTEASTNIQKAIFTRLTNYPDKIPELLHRTKVFLPIGVATILNHKPELISSAILAFCNRDQVDLKYCRAMKYFPPENRVYTSVTFTKCLYAMLTNSRFLPERKVGWNLPEIESKEYKSHILGVKIACGFEILAGGGRNNNEEGKTWQAFLESLTKKDYFNGLLEHSQEYNNLLNKAKAYYKEQKIFSCSEVGSEILDLNRKLDHNFEEFKTKQVNLPKDDDETWMKINPEKLERMLEQRYGSTFTTINESKASDLTGKLSEFLDNVSGLEGAEFPDREVPGRPKRGIKKPTPTKVKFTSDAKQSSNSENKVSFDPANFSCAVQNILDLVIPEDSWDLESGSEMSEYGSESESELDKFDTKSKIKEYMDEMDRELAGTTIGKSFEKKAEDNFDDIESFQPVDIDMTALKNILESYKSQMGEAGPASNMLGPMGVHLEPSTSQK